MLKIVYLLQLFHLRHELIQFLPELILILSSGFFYSKHDLTVTFSYMGFLLQWRTSSTLLGSPSNDWLLILLPITLQEMVLI